MRLDQRPRAQASEQLPAAAAIAYIRVRGENRELVVQREGRPPRPLVRGHPRRQPQDFSWSPDGTRLAVIETLGETRKRIRIIHANGRGSRTLTTVSPPSYYGIAWSPDGNRLAVVRYYAPGYSIELLTIRSGARRRLGRGVDISSPPSWSPDGTRLAFVHVGRDGGPGRAESLIYLLDVRAGRARAAGLGRRVTDPAWHPKRDHFAFVNERGVAVADLKTRRARQVTESPPSRFEGGADNHPVWSPDGRFLAYARMGRLYVIAASGGRPRLFSRGPVVGTFAWRPRRARASPTP